MPYLNVNVVTQGPGPHTQRLGVEDVVLVPGHRESSPSRRNRVHPYH